jgi:hypothetical protein
LVLVACGGPSKDTSVSTDPTTDGDETVETAHTGFTTDPEPEGYVPELPTDVDEPCWQWGVDHVDGEIDGEILNFYDPVTLNQLHYQNDYEPDGDVDYSWDVAYEANGEDYSWIRYDTDGDGAIDQEIDFEYDDAGLRSRYLYDADGDGAWEEVWTYEYVGEVRSMAYVDEGDDGTIDLTYSYTADSADRIVRIDGDRGTDGVIDEVYAYTYADLYTSDYTYTVDDDADGSPEETRTYAFDAEDRVVAYTYDLDDGTSTSTTYTYAPGTEDVVASEGTASYPGQSTYTFTAEYTYEAPRKESGSATHYEFEDGTAFDYTAEWTWTCP